MIDATVGERVCYRAKVCTFQHVISGATPRHQPFHLLRPFFHTLARLWTLPVQSTGSLHSFRQCTRASCIDMHYIAAIFNDNTSLPAQSFPLDADPY